MLLRVTYHQCDRVRGNVAHVFACAARACPNRFASAVCRPPRAPAAFCRTRLSQRGEAFVAALPQAPGARPDRLRRRTSVRPHVRVVASLRQSGVTAVPKTPRDSQTQSHVFGCNRDRCSCTSNRTSSPPIPLLFGVSRVVCSLIGSGSESRSMLGLPRDTAPHLRSKSVR
jgi:hypothetical protein